MHAKPELTRRKETTWEDNIKADYKEVVAGLRIWTGIFAVVTTVMNFGVLYRAGNFCPV